MVSIVVQEMAFNSMFLFFVLLIHPLASHASLKHKYDAIYQFGDSISDTGNFIRENSTSFCSSLPYGETVFDHPTGRCSDGFLIVDFLAKAFRIPLLNPYLEKDANFIHGVNFAVAGSTALDTSFLAQKGVTVLNTNSSLSVQLGWFKTHLKTICSSKEECKHRFGKALFLAGSTGANDYINALFGGKSIQDVYKLVPDVAHVIKDAINKVIENGATHVVVPGYFPFGCTPFFIVNFASNETSVYDEFKCNKAMNELAQYHNSKVKDVVKELQHQHPSVSISYGDLYSAFAWLLRNTASLGFEEGVLKTCCGDGNNVYNFNISRFCGTSGVSACPDPKKRVSWDGIHLTHQAAKYLTNWLLAHN